ncbi:MAG: metal-dependent hydrolase [Methylophilaceae bacterium]
MPSAFAHAVVPIATAFGLGKKYVNSRLLILAVICTAMPDIDVIAFKFGIAYASQWGHRGFTHSIAFAVVVALIAACFSRTFKSHPFTIWLMVFFSTVSHPLLDMLTNGGLGVALYWPFSNERVFFPYHPITVSPIGVGRFFTERGLAVLKSEFIWVVLPSIVWFFLLRGIRQK